MIGEGVQANDVRPFLWYSVLGDRHDFMKSQHKLWKKRVIYSRYTPHSYKEDHSHVEAKAKEEAQYCVFGHVSS